jgi:hypothetical protein
MWKVINVNRPITDENQSAAHTGNSRAIHLFRWVMILPVALFATVGIRSVGMMVDAAPFGLNPNHEIWTLVEVAVDGVAGFFFNITGVYVAPAKQFETSLVLTVIGLLLSGVGLFAVLVLRDWIYLLNPLAFAAGTTLATWGFWEEERKARGRQ